MDWIWLDPTVIRAIHYEQIAEHGGKDGIRDGGLLASALDRPQNKNVYDKADYADLAAAYGYGLIRNHPFIDGNKRTALVITELFLYLNGYDLVASDIECLQIFVALAEGSLEEQVFAAWIRNNSQPR